MFGFEVWERCAADGFLFRFWFRFIWNSGVVCMVISQLAASLAGISVKYNVAAQVPLMEAMTIRGLVGILIVCFICKVHKLEKPFSGEGLPGMLLLSGLFGGGAACCLWVSFSLLPSGDAMAFNRLSCITTVFFAWTVGWESINSLMVVGSIAACLGEIAIAHPPLLFGGHHEWNEGRVVGLMVALSSAIMFSFANMTVGRVGTRVSTLKILLWVQPGFLLPPAAFLCFSYPEPILWDLTLVQVGHMTVYTTFAILKQFFQMRSVQLCNATLATAMATTSVIFSYLLGFLLLGEEMSALAVAGTALVIGGVWVVALGKGKSKPIAFKSEEKDSISAVSAE